MKRKRTCETIDSHATAAFQLWFGKEGDADEKELAKTASLLPSRAELKLIANKPRVWIIDGFLSEGTAKKLFDFVQRLAFKPSQVGIGGGQSVEDYKTSSSAALVGNQAVITELHAKITQLMPGVPLESPLQVVRYEPGQKCELHHDSASLDVSGKKPKVVPTDEKIIRVMTGFLYLNTLPDGGTHFPTLKITVLPKVGRLVLFPDILDTTTWTLDERTIHSAEPTESVKYGLNVWFTNKPLMI